MSKSEDSDDDVVLVEALCVKEGWNKGLIHRKTE